MLKESEVRDNLLDANCSREDIEKIICCLKDGDRKTADRLVSECRKKELTRLHESQKCVDRLDYLSYRMANEPLMQQ